MTPIAGNALLAANIPQSDGGRGRNGFLIHEGRVKEYLSTGKLQSTMGCVRLSHDDMLNLNSMVDSLATQGDIDGKIFVDEFTEPPVRGVEVVSGAYVEPLSH
jgi:hypothetical protein